MAPKGTTEASTETRYTYPEDEEGSVDTLATGGADHEGHYLHLHSTNHTLTITSERAILLFPQLLPLWIHFPSQRLITRSNPFPLIVISPT